MVKITQFFKASSFILVLIAALFSGHSLSASHLSAGDITYKCLGNDEYEIRTTLYRDCSGVNAPSSVSVRISSISCNYVSPADFFLTLQLVDSILPPPDGGIDVSQLCNTFKPCSSCNTPLPAQCAVALPGYKMFIYAGNFIFPEACEDWTINWSQCCRNGAIDNLQGASGLSLYLEAILNNEDAPCNDSPQFLNSPIPYLCAGQAFSYDHQVVEPDGDSLVYSLDTARSAQFTNITYVAPYSAMQPVSTSPINQFGFDSASGNFFFIPFGPQICVVVVRIDEYRRGVYIGTTYREMQLVVENCSNQSPNLDSSIVSVVDSATSTYNISRFCDQDSILAGGVCFSLCQGDTINVTFQVRDPDANGDLTVGANIGNLQGDAAIDTTYLGPGHISVNFTWNNVPSGLHNVTFFVDDGACPIPSRQSAGFRVFVPEIEVITADAIICPGYLDTITLDTRLGSGAQPNGTYIWSPPTGLMPSPLVPNPTLVLDQTAQYVVTYFDGVCFMRDTLDVESRHDLDIFPPTPQVCANSTLQLEALYQTPNESPPCGLNTNPCLNPPATTQIGAGFNVTATPTVYDGFWEDSRVQFLYRAQELLDAGVEPGLLRSIAFEVAQKRSSIPYDNFTIKVGCTSNRSLSSFVPIGLETVFSGSFVSILGWNTHTFQTPYAWDGVSNLIVEVCYDNSSYTQREDMFTETMPFTCTIYDRVDGGTGCTLNGAKPSTERPNTQFGHCKVNVSATYQWSPTAGIGTGDDTIRNPMVSVGNQSIWYKVVADDGECEVEDSIFIEIIPELDIQFDVSAVKCDGSSTGIAAAVPQNGVGPYTFSWNTSPPSNDSILSGVPAGTYIVNVTDQFGCTGQDTIVLDNPMAAVYSETTTAESCPGFMDGTAQVVLPTGSNPSNFNIIWGTNPIQVGTNAYQLSAGNYGVTITSSNGCQDSLSVNVGGASAIVSTFDVQNAGCNRGDDAWAAISSTGGTPPFTYAWDNGQMGDTLKGVTSGTYQVTITDDKGCQTTEQVNLTEPSTLFAQYTSTDISCGQENDGTIDLIVSGGTPPYSYIWTDNTLPNSGNLTNLWEGAYYVTVRDAAGCEAYLGPIELDRLYQPVVNGGEVQYYYVEAGSTVNLNVSSSVGGVSWAWSPPTFLDNPNIFNPKSIAPDSTVMYTVTANNNGCLGQGVVWVVVRGVIAIPNAFRPGGDNPTFGPIVRGEVFIEEFKVFNRWGQEVHSNRDTNWDGSTDGKAMPMDTYVYKVIARRPGEEAKTYSGEVLLIR